VIYHTFMYHKRSFCQNALKLCKKKKSGLLSVGEETSQREMVRGTRSQPLVREEALRGFFGFG
jgi:hypothetical protein